jgi:hypothetical protein
MRLIYLLPVISLLLISCGGRTISPGFAENLIIDMPEDNVEKEDVEVVNIIQTSKTEAIAESKLKTAFRLERVQGKWVVREIKIGHGPWEPASHLAPTLEAIRIDETRRLLDRLAEAIQKYRETNGSLPVFRNYVALSDLLSPQYLTPLIRMDAWRHPLGAARDKNSIVIWSAGPDGKSGTNDDIRKIIS